MEVEEEVGEEEGSIQRKGSDAVEPGPSQEEQLSRHDLHYLLTHHLHEQQPNLPALGTQWWPAGTSC